MTADILGPNDPGRFGGPAPRPREVDRPPVIIDGTSAPVDPAHTVPMRPDDTETLGGRNSFQVTIINPDAIALGLNDICATLETGYPKPVELTAEAKTDQHFQGGKTTVLLMSDSGTPHYQIRSVVEVDPDLAAKRSKKSKKVVKENEYQERASEVTALLKRGGMDAKTEERYGHNVILITDGSRYYEVGFPNDSNSSLIITSIGRERYEDNSKSTQFYVDFEPDSFASDLQVYADTYGRVLDGVSEIFGPTALPSGRIIELQLSDAVRDEAIAAQSTAAVVTDDGEIGAAKADLVTDHGDGGEQPVEDVEAATVEDTIVITDRGKMYFRIGDKNHLADARGCVYYLGLNGEYQLLKKPTTAEKTRAEDLLRDMRERLTNDKIDTYTPRGLLEWANAMSAAYDPEEIDGYYGDVFAPEVYEIMVSDEEIPALGLFREVRKRIATRPIGKLIEGGADKNWILGASEDKLREALGDIGINESISTQLVSDIIAYRSEILAEPEIPGEESRDIVQPDDKRPDSDATLSVEITPAEKYRQTLYSIDGIIHAVNEGRAHEGRLIGASGTLVDAYLGLDPSERAANRTTLEATIKYIDGTLEYYLTKPHTQPETPTRSDVWSLQTNQVLDAIDEYTDGEISFGELLEGLGFYLFLYDELPTAIADEKRQDIEIVVRFVQGELSHIAQGGNL